jgi:hypothetical protein
MQFMLQVGEWWLTHSSYINLTLTTTFYDMKFMNENRKPAMSHGAVQDWKEFSRP